MSTPFFKELAFVSFNFLLQTMIKELWPLTLKQNLHLFIPAFLAPTEVMI